MRITRAAADSEGWVPSAADFGPLEDKKTARRNIAERAQEGWPRDSQGRLYPSRRRI